MPEQGVELGQHFGRKASGQAVARQGEQLMKMAQAHAYQRCADFAGQAEALDRQYPERLMQRGRIGHGQPVMGIGEDARGRRIGCQGDAVAEAQGREFLAQTLLESWPGAEQAEAGMHLQQQTARVLQADLGAVAVTPGRQKLLPAFDHQRVVIGSGEVVGQCLGCDQRLPWFEAELAGGGVDSLQHAALWRAGEQNQWCGGIVAVAQDAVHGQLRQ